MGFPGCSTGEESAWNAGALGSIPGLGRSPGEGNGYPLQYSGLENSMDSIVHGSQRVRHDLATFTHFTQGTLVVKNLPAIAGNMRCRCDPWVREVLGRRAWKPTPVFFPGKSHVQRSLVGYSPWYSKEWDTTEAN